ncbi:MAG TPA: TadE/TadG family type IV pilus assembly protein [Planctomycetota bacterium]|nr:TadE/TadG family type IV pilus assembly protein [Planctomycetota bacterium]
MIKPRARLRGLAIVEAALVVPLLFLILIGSIQYGWCFLKVQQLEQAARQGARTGVLQTATTTNVNNKIATVMNSAGLGSSGYTVAFRNATAGTTITDVADPAQLPVGDLLEVTVTVPDYSVIGVINAPLIPMPTSVEGQTAMMKEGPL